MDYGKFLKYLVKWEGLKLKAYQDSVGIWTIGIGTIKYPDGKPVKKGDVITEKQAYDYAKHEAVQKFTAISKFIKVPQTENQLIALLSLAYNIGTSGFEKSSVLKSINGKDTLSNIESYWKRWNKGTINGQLKVIDGLTNRRKDEFLLYSGKQTI